MADTVLLRCPKCARQSVAERDPLDPDNAAVVEVMCPECNPGDFDCPAFRDASGAEIDWRGEAA